MADDKITLGVGFELDKNSLNQIRTELEKLQSLSMTDMQKINGSSGSKAQDDLRKISNTAREVESALTQAFNPKLNTINLQTFNRSLKQAGLSTKEIYTNFSKAGAAGTSAFRTLANQITTFNKELKQGHKVLDKVAETLGNTIKWNIASSAINTLSSNIQQAYGYVKSLDHSLNDIRIVTGKSAESMKDFAVQANDAARSLGTTTTEYTKSALTFYQQGLDDEEANARATLSNKVANVTGLSGDQSAEYVTAVLNGYKVGSEEAEHAMDKLAAVGAATAADLGGLSEAMSKVASSANAMGVSEDQLAATLATVMSITRQSASTIGTAFKTIYARIADINAGADDAEATLGEYTGRMAALGFNVLDSSGKLRDLGEVMEEVGDSWSDLSREQQIALARTMAGTRQYNNLIALFDNWDDYIQSLNVSLEANGTLQEQQAIYMQSTAAHLDVLKASMENVYDSFLDADDINNVADSFSHIADFLANFLDSIEGGKGLLRDLGAIAVMVFSNQIGKSLNTTIQNFLVAKNNIRELENAMQTISTIRNIPGLDSATNQMMAMKNELYSLSKYMSPEVFQEIKLQFDEFAKSLNVVDELQQDQKALETFLSKIPKAGLNSPTITLDNLQKPNMGAHGQTNADRVNMQIIKVQEGFEKARGLVFDFKKSIEDANLKDGFTPMSESISTVIKQLKELASQGAISSEEVEKIEKSYQKGVSKKKVKGQKNKSKQQVFEDNVGRYKNLYKQAGQLLNTGEDQFESLANKLQLEFDNVPEAVTSSLKRAEEQAKLTGQSIGDSLKIAAREEIISNFTRMAGAVGSVTMSIQTLKNIGSIWADDDLEFGEQVLQTITNLSMGLPMLISGITAFRTGLQGIISAKKTYATTSSMVAAIEIKEAAAATADAAAKGTQAAATDKATVSQLGLNAAMLANPATLVAIAVGGLIAILAALTKAYKKNREEQAKGRKEKAEYALSIGKEADELKKTYVIYQNLYDQYRRNNLVTDELKESTLQLAKAYDIQVNSLDLIAGRYDKINQKILETRKNQLQKGIEDTSTGIENLSIGTAMQHPEFLFGTGKVDVRFNQGYLDDINDEKIGAILDKHLEKLDYYSFDLNETFGAMGVQTTNKTIAGVNKEDFFLLYEEISKVIKEAEWQYSEDTLRNSELFNSMKQWLADNQEGYQKYQELINSKLEQALELAEVQGSLNLNNATISSYEDYQKFANQYKEQLRQTLGGDKEIEKIYDPTLFGSVEDFLNSKTNSFLGKFSNFAEYAESAQASDDLYKALVGHQKEITDQQKQDLQDFVNSFTSSDLHLIASIGIDKTTTKEEVQAALELAQNQINHTPLNFEVISAMQTYAKLQNSSKKLTKTQEEELINSKAIIDSYLVQIDSLKEYANAKEEWIAISQTGTAASLQFLQDLMTKDEEYGERTVDSLYKLKKAELDYAQTKLFRLKQDDEYYNGLDAKIKRYKNLAEKVNSPEADYRKNAYRKTMSELFANEEDFNNSVSALANYRSEVSALSIEIGNLKESLNGESLELTIKAQNFEEMKAVGEQTVQEIEEIKKAADLIQENLTVKPEDVDALRNIYPELVASAQVAADGTLELNKAITESFIKSQKDIVAADTETYIAKAENRIAEIDAQQAVLKDKKDNVKLMKRFDSTTIKDEQDLIDNLQQFGIGVAEASRAAYELMSGNITTFNEYIQDALKDTISVAHETAKAIEGIGKGEVQGDILDFSTSANKVYTSEQIRTQLGQQGYSNTEIERMIWESQNTGDKTKISAAIGIKPGLTFGDNFHIPPEILNALNQNVDATNQARNKMLNDIVDEMSANENEKAVLKSYISKLRASNSSIGKDKDGNENEQLDFLDDLKDKYYAIDLEIKKLERELKKLKKQQDLLYGADLVDNLNKQLVLIEKQRKAYHKKIELMQQEAKLSREILSAKGVTFDSEGYITNFVEVLQAKIDAVNALYAKYNTLSKAEQKEFKKVTDEAKKEYDDFKKEMEEYNKIVIDTIPDLEEKIEDTLYDEVSTQIEKFDVRIEMRLDMSEAERDWNEFKRRVIDDLDDDDLVGRADKNYRDFLSYYNTNGTGTGSIQERTNRTNTVLAELQKMNNGGHSDIYSSYDEKTGTWIDDKKSALEDLAEGYKGLMDELQDLENLEDEVKQNFLDSIDAVNDSYNAQKDNYELVNNQLIHDIQLMQLLYGDEAYDRMDEYYSKQIKNIKAELAAQEKAKAFWKSKMDAEQAAVAAGSGNKDALAKYEENWKEALSNVNDLVETWGNQLLTQYENNINKMIKALNDKLSNGLGLEYIEEELRLLDDNAENYLDTVNSTYEKQKLANKWKEAIDNTDSLNTQQQLNNLMQEQMKMLEEKGKLTQYDIDRAEKEYQIALKQIALQEAQQNKSSMRLKRDANGNYSYQFVADEDKIADAQQELADAQNDLYNFDKSAYNKNLNDMYSAWKEFQEKIADAYKKYGNDQAKLTETIGLLQEQYGEKLNFITEQNLNIRNNLHSSAFDELSELYDIDRQKFEEMTEAEKDLIFNELIPQWDSGVQQMIDKFAGEGGFGPICEETFKNLSNVSTDYQSNLDELKNKNAEVTEEALEEGDQLLDLSEQVIDKAIEEHDRIGNVIQQVLQLIETYKQAKQAAIDATNAAYAYAQSERAREEPKGSNNTPTKNPIDTITKPNNPNKDKFEGKDNNPAGSNGSFNIGDVVKFVSGTYYSDSAGSTPLGNKYHGEQVEINFTNPGSEYPYHMKLPSINGQMGWIGWVKKDQLSRFDTGGYTGTWGDEGRMAMLHQKELVLNKTDTENMLNAIDVLRNIISTLGTNAFDKASALLTNIAPNTSLVQNSSKEMEQTVYINAQFEGQTEAVQIQTALNNLINVAAQRANTKKR